MGKGKRDTMSAFVTHLTCNNTVGVGDAQQTSGEHAVHLW